jgi:hypothetical protein
VFQQRQEMLETMGINTGTGGGKLTSGKRMSLEDVWLALASAFHTFLVPGVEVHHRVATLEVHIRDLKPLTINPTTNPKCLPHLSGARRGVAQPRRHPAT